MRCFRPSARPAWASAARTARERFTKRGASSARRRWTKLTVGLQLGGQAYSQIIFFQDKRALDEFTSGNFEFGAQATAVAITAGASASASTAGASAGASGGQHDASTVDAGGYHKGMAVFTVAKGGLMYESLGRRAEVFLHAAEVTLTAGNRRCVVSRIAYCLANTGSGKLRTSPLQAEILTEH